MPFWEKYIQHAALIGLYIQQVSVLGSTIPAADIMGLGYPEVPSWEQNVQQAAILVPGNPTDCHLGTRYLAGAPTWD